MDDNDNDDDDDDDDDDTDDDCDALRCATASGFILLVAATCQNDCICLCWIKIIKTSHCRRMSMTKHRNHHYHHNQQQQQHIHHHYHHRYHCRPSNRILDSTCTFPTVDDDVDTATLPLCPLDRMQPLDKRMVSVAWMPTIERPCCKKLR